MTPIPRAAVNAANAQFSTGPSTQAGKARSSRNAVKHGLTSKQLVIAPGEEDEFAELHHSPFEQLAPEGALEMGVFNILVHSAWQLQRFRVLEAELMANGVDALLDESTAKALDRLQRYASANQRSYYRAIRELRTVQNNRLLRRTLDGHAGDPVPELVCVAQLAKQTELHQADDMVSDWIHKEMELHRAVQARLQNEPTRTAGGAGCTPPKSKV